MVVIKRFFYKESQTIVVQGNKSVINSYIKKGYRIIRGGNGTYIMSLPSVAGVVFEVDNDGIERSQDVKQLIRDFYGVKRVTRSKLEEFVIDCNLKTIKLKFSEEKGLYF